MINRKKEGKKLEAQEQSDKLLFITWTIRRNFLHKAVL